MLCTSCTDVAEGDPFFRFAEHAQNAHDHDHNHERRQEHGGFFFTDFASVDTTVINMTMSSVVEKMTSAISR